MRLFICILLLLFSPLSGQNIYQEVSMRTVHTKGQAAISSSTHLVAYSMIAWGVLIGLSAAIIASVAQGRS